MSFRRSARTPKLTADAASRQGRVTFLALDLLGGKDAALAFLNSHHEDLAGRPLDIAVASAEGLRRVLQVLSAMSGRSVAPA